MKAHVPRSAARPVSRSHDASEREAERAADVVTRGGSVSGWSFSAMPASPVQRQDVAPKEKSEDEKKKEALKKAGEAALATPQGQALKEKVLKDPVVKSVTDAVTSTPGLIAGGAAIAGGVAALAATGKELPFQPPEIPLEKVSPKLAGISAKVTVEGPLNAPTYAGLTITVKEQGEKGKGTKPDPIAADIARLRAQEEMFKRGRTYAPGSKEAEEERLLDEAVTRYVLSRSALPGITIPLIPPTAPEREEQKPAQPAPESASAAPPEHADVDAAFSTSGRPLDPGARRAMEARFGRDFSHVRVHDDARASATAEAIHAAAFTVGDDIAFAPGRYDPARPDGGRLLAHELTHVVQQAAGRKVIQRKAEPHVTSPGDPEERKADEVAARVAAGLPAATGGALPAQPGIARQETAGGDEEEDELTWPELEDEEDADRIEASREGGPVRAPRGFSQMLAASGPGDSLPGRERRTLEGAFGTSFASVRMHRDSASDRLAGSIRAEAFTAGSHVYLAARAPDPSTPTGLRLLAHELTHVHQQETSRGPAGLRVQRLQALYFSTHGRQGYFRFAERFHRDRGFPAPVRVASVEEMLEHLTTLGRAVDRVRLVTHAVPAGIFLPLLRDGTTSLYAADLALQHQTALESELAEEHPTIRTRPGDDPRAFAVRTLEHHVVPQTWVSRAYTRVVGTADGAAWLRSRRFPGSVTQGGDLEKLIWWILDRELLQAQRERDVGRGRRRFVHVLPGLSAAARNTAIASRERNAAIYRELAIGHLLLRGYPGRGTPDQRRAAAATAVADFERRLVAVTGDLIDDELRRGPQQFQVAQPSPRYQSIQGAIERGTFANNLLFAKTWLPNRMPFEIRGCRIGQNQGWLESFRDFWGLGAGATRRRPEVSAPDLRHIFGLRRGNSAEWLQRPRRGVILGGTPEFDQHIVRVR